MATAKDEIRRILETLPDDATWEDLQYSIYVRERIERGRREVEQGNLISQEEVENRMKQWLDTVLHSTQPFAAHKNLSGHW